MSYATNDIELPHAITNYRTEHRIKKKMKENKEEEEVEVAKSTE